MAMDIVMVKGDTKIKISPDFQEYYEKKGFTVEGKNKTERGSLSYDIKFRISLST